MAHAAFHILESALRSKQLDRTLTTALAPLDRSGPSSSVATGVTALDACLRGGLPRGQLSEIAGPRSSGRTTVLMQMLSAATGRGEIVALVDASDCLDVQSAADAGVDLTRLLWIRGQGQDNLERALKALNLVLQAGGFAIVAIDLADVPPAELRGIPYTTWLRVQRTIEGSDTACVLLGHAPMARSAGGLTLALTGQSSWAGTSDRSRRLTGARTRVQIHSPRRHVEGTASVVSTVA